MLMCSTVSSPEGYYIPPERYKKYYQQSQDNQPIPQADQQPQQGRKGSSLFQTLFLANVGAMKTNIQASLKVILTSPTKFLPFTVLL